MLAKRWHSPGESKDPGLPRELTVSSVDFTASVYLIKVKPQVVSPMAVADIISPQKLPWRK